MNHCIEVDHRIFKNIKWNKVPFNLYGNDGFLTISDYYIIKEYVKIKLNFKNPVETGDVFTFFDSITGDIARMKLQYMVKGSNPVGMDTFDIYYKIGLKLLNAEKGSEDEKNNMDDINFVGGCLRTNFPNHNHNNSDKNSHCKNRFNRIRKNRTGGLRRCLRRRYNWRRVNTASGYYVR